MRYRRIFSFLAAVGLLALSVAARGAAAACVVVPFDLGAGSTDRNAQGHVTELQDFLRGADFLTATPNGVYGPATTAAVRAYQAKAGLPATGFVGPLTRAKIQADGCAASSASNPSSVSMPSPVPVPAQPSIAPAVGATLTIGKTFDIALTEKSAPQSVILEDKSGTARGYIASSLVGVSRYFWTVGRVYSSASGRDETVDPGDYRIRIVDAQAGPTAKDPISGVFTLAGEQASIDLVRPESVKSADSSAIVVFGSGFTSATRLYLGGYRNIEAERLFVSADGHVFVFSVPKGTAAGRYYLTVTNRYGTTDTAASIVVSE
jgi:hypothetical protein